MRFSTPKTSARLHGMVRALPLLAMALALPASAAWNHFDPTDTSKVPKLFSATGFYSNMAAKTVTADAIPFDVNTPLWSDNAVKSRWVILKTGSAKIQFDPANDYFDYPDGAVFVKLFQQDTIAGNAASRIYWETRVLVNKKKTDTLSLDPLKVVNHDEWYGFSYKWKTNGSDAALVNWGLDTSLTVTVKGVKTFRKWRFPSESDCNECHRKYEAGMDVQGRAVLGFFTPQLNRPMANDATTNQIRSLFQKNILGWSKAAPTEAELALMPKWARMEDANASLELRSRAYIASNCSGCHGTRGLATNATGHATPLNYDYFKLEGGALKPEMDLYNKQVGFYGLEPIDLPGGQTLNPTLISPGRPELSVLLHRMKSRNRSVPTEDTAFNKDANQMPPLAVFEVDTVAVKVVTDWIASLPQVSIRHAFAGQSRGGTPMVHGNLIILPEGFSGVTALFGMDGRRLELVAMPGRAYRLPQGLPSGVYLLKAGGREFRILL